MGRPEEPADAFGAFVRRELRAHRWSLRYLAMRSGVDHSTIARLIHGQRQPSLRTALRIQDALQGRTPSAPPFPVGRAAEDPMRTVAEALRMDPHLNEDARAAVFSYYRAVRSSTPGAVAAVGAATSPGESAAPTGSAAPGTSAGGDARPGRGRASVRANDAAARE